MKRYYSSLDCRLEKYEAQDGDFVKWEDVVHEIKGVLAWCELEQRASEVTILGAVQERLKMMIKDGE